MIYDCFLFFNELNILKLRLEELNPVVDRFVLVEGTRTFSGHPKPLYFENNKFRFQKYLGKISHIVVDDLPLKYESPWDMESHQRNAMLRGLMDASQDDIVAISDVDEIPRANIVESFDGTFSALELDLFYYRLNCRDLASKWVAPLLVRKRYLTNPQEARMLACHFWENGTPVLTDAGWHFSCMQDAAGLRLKLQSFSHQEYNTSEFTDISSIENKIKYGLDFLNRRDHSWCCVPLDDTFPAYLFQHRNEFTDLLFDFTEFHKNRQSLIYSLTDELEKKNCKLEKADQTFAELKGQALLIRQEIQQIQNSKSWKLSEPLRSVAEMVRRLSHQVRPK